MSNSGCFSDIFCVFSCSSKWRKTSKCKYYINNLQRSIEIHGKRLESMVRQSRSDYSQLRHTGRFREAIPKAKQICKDERRLLAYDKVEYFCTFILKNLSFLKRQSDVHQLPDDVQEAMAGLIFAASRIGELKELEYIRDLFIDRFGLEFDRKCVDLSPGNVVGSEIVRILDRTLLQDEITNIVEKLEKLDRLKEGRDQTPR